MERQHPDEQAALKQDLRQARARLEALVRTLREVDGRLEWLEAERAKYALLETACSALYELDTLGAGGLFWSGRETPGGAGEHLRLVRGRIDEFEKQLALVEERRQSLLEEIEREQDGADLVAGDILDAQRIAEERSREWAVERDPGPLPIRLAVMPWTGDREADRRFRRTLLVALLLCLLIGAALPWIEIPIPERWEILEQQERLTQLIREDLPLPPVVVAEEKPVEPVVPEEAASIDEESDAPTVADTAQRETDPAPSARPNTGSAAGPGTGAGARGILAFREQFSGIASTNAPVDRLGSNAQIHDPSAVANGGLPERSLVTSQAPGASGGINVAALSRGTGGTGNALSGVAVARATSTLGSGTGNGGGGGGTGTGSGRKVGGAGAMLGRTDEEIQIVFDRYKSALYRLYNRELRQDPTLKGQMVLRLTIQPDGSVSFCEVKSTDMKAPQLASQVVERVKSFDFGAKPGISAVTIVYPIDFLPAT